MKLSALLACSIAMTTPAFALQQPAVSPKDSRVLFADYDPGNPIPLHTVVGGLMVVDFGDDWIAYDIEGADTTRVYSDPNRHQDQFVVWQARGCVPPSMVYVFFQNQAGKKRMQPFEIRTTPTACDTSSPPEARKSTPEVRSASILTASANAAEFDPRQMWGHGLAWMPAADAMTEHPKPNQVQDGTPTVWTLKVRYPQDEREKRLTKAAAEREQHAARAVEEGLVAGDDGAAGGAYDPSCKSHFLYRGPPALEPDPYTECQNGFSTRFVYANRRVPVLSYLSPDNKETSETPVHRGDALVAMRVAHVWLVRDGDAVGEIVDCNNAYGCHYPPVASDPGTGTDNPHYRRVIRGKRKVARNAQH